MAKLASLFMSMLVSASVHTAASNADDVFLFNWEEFDAAISEEDCFGSDCGASSGALSMLQKTYKVKGPRRMEEDDIDAALEAAFDEIDDIPSEALSLVQTDAAVERTAVPKHETMSGAVLPDGSFEMNPQPMKIPQDGMMAFSVDEHGGLHAEDRVSLMQMDVHTEKNEAAGIQTSGNVPDPDATSQEELSLVQTDAAIEQQKASSEHAAMSVAALPDGSFEMNPQTMIVPEDGKMFFSVDVHGGLHAEDGMSMIQTEADVEDADLMESAEESPEGLSLIQTEAALQQNNRPMSGAVLADGSFEMNPRQTEIPKDGVMALSVDAMGAFHFEM